MTDGPGRLLLGFANSPSVTSIRRLFHKPHQGVLKNMKIRCQYCNAYIDDTNTICPTCGAPNPGVVRTVSTQPLTIEQLQSWYAEHHLPPYEVTRFFIGVDCREARAFGIYREGSNFVVYKNKSDGSRAIRYKGTDEAYAVNEIFQRFFVIDHWRDIMPAGKQKTIAHPHELP